MIADIPWSLDEVIRDSRACVARLRHQYGNREDFDHHVRQAVKSYMEAYGDHPTTIRYVLRVVFDD